ncbi:MAG: 23S rRNA (adenine(2030)-N(6))-methyltransferase RlmJ [Hyphomicrobiales bacterium]|nr:23S rRNA (adenine(2030)-N(6))-methyltransferase RlmJ [Hyphomicrobiales bacterium]
MNYRHAFHAGGPADVVKHAALTRILVSLRAKPAAFRIIDTHAGPGLYNLRGPEAARSPEWRDGIGRLLAACDEGGGAATARALLAPYLEVVAALNPAGALAIYPGSPLIARALLRAQDRLVACELAPDAAAALSRHLHGDRRSKAIAIDGWTALNAYVPPPERRGLVLIDPPFEAADEFSRLATALDNAYRKWATGIFLLWYPLGGRRDPETLVRRLRRSAIAKLLRIEIDFALGERARGCGLIAVNPPWLLADELATLLPFLAQSLSGRHRLDWIARDA